MRPHGDAAFAKPDGMDTRTIAEARRALAAKFRAGGLDTPDLDARILVGHALGLDHGALAAAAARRLGADEENTIAALANRRLTGEPVARILGFKEFWGLPLQLSAATLVPRPDTETLVELALEILRGEPRPDRRWRIADIGTGSGAILLALLSELSWACGVGTDISVAALRTARSNAAQLGFAPRATFVACDYAAALPGPFDLIVSNPPYIRSAEIAGLGAEVRHHDPRLALDGGADGLAAYRAIAPEAVRLLAAGGVLAMELGYGQSADVEALMTAAGLTLERPPKADLTGIPRAAAFRKLPR
jgi:release factor glutamine methyltransferase